MSILVKGSIMGKTLEQLRREKDEIENAVLKKLREDNTQIKIMADNMAEAATNIQGQGYGNFVNARQTFLSEVDRISKEYAYFVCKNPK